MFSYASPQPVVCGACSTEATMSLWLIVSTHQPPPPFVTEGREQFHECPNCGALTIMVAPLIVMNIGGQPPMFLVPMATASDEENRAAFNSLLDQVYATMGDAWRNEYLQSAEFIDRAQLRELWPATD